MVSGPVGWRLEALVKKDDEPGPPTKLFGIGWVTIGNAVKGERDNAKTGGD
jgi:hypothetical protein